jgi:hypothetical protein
MNIQRAQQLTKSYGMSLVQGPDYVLELYHIGEYIGELYPAQIAEMDEEDFIEYYLTDGESPSDKDDQLSDYIEYRNFNSDQIHDVGYSSKVLSSSSLSGFPQ